MISEAIFIQLAGKNRSGSADELYEIIACSSELFDWDVKNNIIHYLDMPVTGNHMQLQIKY